MSEFVAMAIMSGKPRGARSAQSQPAAPFAGVNEGRLAEVVRTIGGELLIGRVDSVIAVHDLIKAGLPTASALLLVDSLTRVGSTEAAKAMGVSLRTVQRLKKKGSGERLSVDQSDRTWQFAEVLARATEVLGSREEAERWLGEPAIGLDQRRPIDLLGTTAGTEAVKVYLDRMDYGVYA